MQVKKQIGDNDSLAACVATILDVPVSLVWAVLGLTPHYNMVSTPEAVAMLSYYGWDTEVYETKELTAQVTGIPLSVLAGRHWLYSEAELRQRMEAEGEHFYIATVVDDVSMLQAWSCVLCYKGIAYDPSPNPRYVGSATSLPVVSAIKVRRRALHGLNPR